MAAGPGLRAGLMGSLGLLGALSAAGFANAQQPEATDTANAAGEEVIVTGERYDVEKLSSPKYVRPLVDTPQTVNVVSDQLLIEQGRRTLRDTLRNVTGISLQAGEGNPPGGDNLKIRGFSARDDILVDGIRDVGNYFRDPFNAERVEVTKGPASAFGGRGNVGGTVNIVSRLPKLDNTATAEFSIGTGDLYRTTADVNRVLSEENGIALRINAMGHSADEPGRDHVKNERWAIAPSLAFGLGSPTVVTLSYLHLEQDDVPDYGLPNARNLTLAGSGLEGAVAPVDSSNFYGYGSDYRDVVVDTATLRLEHSFSDAIALRSQVRYGRTHNDTVISAPPLRRRCHNAERRHAGRRQSQAARPD